MYRKDSKYNMKTNYTMQVNFSKCIDESEQRNYKSAKILHDSKRVRIVSQVGEILKLCLSL